MNDDATDQQRRSLALALQHAGLSAGQLWLRYFALGGDAGPIEVDAYVHGLSSLDPLQRDILAHAVNERLDELTWTHRASYTRPFRASEPRSEPLAALVTLLDGAELAPPDRLPVIAEAAGQALGLTVGIHLIDYAQRCLYPLPATRLHTGNGKALDVDTTLAGRAFRQVQMLPADVPGSPRLWVPLVDGAERLGVLEVGVASTDDLYDPGLRTQCRWLASLLGHVVTAQSQYGDGIDRVRIRDRRTVNGELVWSLLPPQTAGVDNFVVTALLEPGQNVNGDAFDYALSETTADLIVVDAVGHDLHSGLIAATALAAYRSARHSGHRLYEQARTIDEAINQQFGGTAFASAVLVELDLATGRLRYVNAGHPHPLIMRSGKIVRPLAGGRRQPLGLGWTDLVIGEESLQPDDWLVLHTDGITEARDDTGDFFGDARLADFLRREAAAGHPPPETARRLVRAVLTHQHGVLQDDATVLLARWTTPSQIVP
ncbi:phosphatase [Lentzea sp. NBRC 105346]|uniref:PP2C family protein-serine/threonine phosphatase n=1 Tax=Lentzea sp. NBRC 105346 TaxID=3032205 RepID=UPI0024A33813|nr:PP2C family protein-serine/threonine phosphatase [Lentzea sp. NBRC 105346]GLZ27965.1 phosphatase [Lentzea sp. NBRC 105346]